MITTWLGGDDVRAVVDGTVVGVAQTVPGGYDECRQCCGMTATVLSVNRLPSGGNLVCRGRDV